MFKQSFKNDDIHIVPVHVSLNFAKNGELDTSTCRLIMRVSIQRTGLYLCVVSVYFEIYEHSKR